MIMILRHSSPTKIKILVEQEIRGRIEIIQTTALFKSERIIRRLLKTWCYLDLPEKPPVQIGLKKLTITTKSPPPPPPPPTTTTTTIKILIIIIIKPSIT